MAADENSTVYLLGAGVNRVIRHPSPSGVVCPPLIRDFFQVASKLDYWPGAEDQWLRSLTPEQLEEFRRKGTGPHTGGQRFKEAYQRVYDYIERNWNKSYDALASEDFDLEEIFTQL